jgi:(S)-ureidoglycine aminohydrolase
MKLFLNVLISALSLFGSSRAQEQLLPSKVNLWSTSDAVKRPFGSESILLKGAGKVLEAHQIKGITLLKGKSIEYAADSLGVERFFIVKEGNLQVELNHQDYEIGKGSVILLLPGDHLKVRNRTKATVSFYEMMASNTLRDNARGRKGGPSFVMDWKDMVFKPHNRGGVRQLFDRQTAMMNRFDIHITTLNPGLKSHDPHTHINEEIILMVEGIGEMFIGDGPQRINTGDVCYLGSTVLHNITNISSTPITYFAIQWN